MESEDNFFLIQQLQEKEQLAESKNKHHNEMKKKFGKELGELETMLNQIDTNHNKANHEMKSLGNQVINETFNEEDLENLKYQIAEVFKSIDPNKEVKAYDPVFLLSELELKLNSQISKLVRLQKDNYSSQTLLTLEKNTK